MGKYVSLANAIVEKVGGKTNISSLTHCVTRLRFQLVDAAKADTESLKNMDGVVTVMETAGQYQVVIGNHVPEVFKDVCEAAGISAGVEEVKVKQTFSQKALDIISGIFMPSIGILCASGILKGINVLLNMSGLIPEASGLGLLLAAAADAMFLFFPIFIGFNAFKKLGGNPFLGMALAAGLCYPSIQGVDLDVLGMSVNASYTSTVLPIVLLSLLAVPAEKFLNRIVPDVVKNFVVPAAILMVFLPLGFSIIGPAANMVGTMMNTAIQNVYAFSPLLASILMGFTWQLLVLIGCHVLVLLPILMGLIAGVPQPLMPIVSIAAFVTTGATFAVWMKTKNKKLKETALPAWISGIFGVTEPAIYGVTLPNGKLFLMTCFGTAAGAALASVLGVTSYVPGGMGIFLLPGLIDAANPMGSVISALILFGAAMLIGFVLTIVMYKDAEKKEMIEDEKAASIIRKETVCAPLQGHVIPLAKVEDAAFSSGALGHGIAIEPTEGKVVAPFSGTVMTLFPTKHAIGIVSDNGCEVLIHVGMDTVQLDGKGFEAHVKQGDKVKQGDVLVTFDMDFIKNEGYSLVTPVIVTNTKDYADVVEMASGHISHSAQLLNALN